MYLLKENIFPKWIELYLHFIILININKTWIYLHTKSLKDVTCKSFFTLLPLITYNHLSKWIKRFEFYEFIEFQLFHVTMVGYLALFVWACSIVYRLFINWSQLLKLMDNMLSPLVYHKLLLAGFIDTFYLAAFEIY